MDTFWFAVDLDGHIGCFETGESGAIPSGAYNDENGLWKLLRVLPKDKDGISYFFIPEHSLDLLLNLQSLQDYIDKYVAKGVQVPFFFFHDLVIEFKSETWVSKLTLKEVVVKLHAEREIYYFGKTESAEVLALFLQNELAGVTFRFIDDDIIADATQCFYYTEKSQHSHGRGISDYQRTGSPQNPTKSHSLPVEAQDIFKFTLPVRFADKEIIQPLEFGKARASEDYYINSDGEKVEYDFDRDSGVAYLND